MDRHHRKKTTETKNYSRLADIFSDLAELLRPPERITITEAAEKYVRLNNPGSYIGPYKSEIAPYMQEPSDTLTSREHTGMVFVGPAQCGKALSVTTPIATPTGWTTMGKLRVGDLVFGDDGEPVTVIAVSPVMRDRVCYRITFDDRSDIVADAEHLWLVRDDYAENWKLLETRQIVKAGIKFRGNRFRFSVPNTAPLQTEPYSELQVSPYTLGAWLGDGNSYSSHITSHMDDAPEIVAKIEAEGYIVEVTPQQENTVTLKIDPQYRLEDKYDSIRQRLTGLGLLSSAENRHEKHIPEKYLRANAADRLELLRGLMDTDGYASGKVCEFSSTSERLADGVYELATSLGFKVRRRTKEPTTIYKGERVFGQTSYLIVFNAYRDRVVPFSLSRKVERLPLSAAGRPTYTGRRRIESIEEVTSVPVRCIAVGNDSHLFLAGRQMVPTHNTESLILSWVAYSVKVDPMDMIVFNPTQASARDFSMRRVSRLHRNSPDIGEVLLKNRDSDNVFDKHYRTGMILNLSWPSVSEFAGRPVGRIALTDYDRMPDDIEGDGNPYDLASKRTTSFRSFAMTLAESSPSREVENPKWIKSSPHEAPPCKGVLGLYNRGDRRRWYWPCPHCGSYFEGRWSQVEWDTKQTKLESAETARLICPANGCRIEQRDRPEMQRWGIWLREGQGIAEDGRIVGQGTRSIIASFWLNGIAAAFTTWANLVMTFLNAQEHYDKTADEEPLKKFWNTDLGEPYIPKSAELERLPEVLKSRAEELPYTVVEDATSERVHRDTMIGIAIEPLVPNDVRFLIASVDVQTNMFAVQVHGVCAGDPYDMVLIDRFAIRKSRRLDLNGEHLWVKPASHLEDWAEVTSEVIKRTYALADGSGRRMIIKLTVCDSAGKAGSTTNAYNYQRKLRQEGLAGRFHLVKGDRLPSRPRTQITFPDANKKDNLSAARGDVPVMLLNSNALKDALVGRLESMTPGRGMFRFPTWLPDWWYAEMCAEVRTDKGWIPTNYRRNESFDLSYYALAACVSVLVRAEGINWKKPPGWAETWDKNDLITKPKQTEVFAKPENASYDFTSLGKVLA